MPLLKEADLRNELPNMTVLVLLMRECSVPYALETLLA